MSKPTGVDLIAAERQRQIAVEGWTPEHDDQHAGQEMALAACYYAMPTLFHSGTLNLEAVFWPATWSVDRAKKHRKARLHQLAVAGALIAAEIDRLQRAGQ